jgi:hypothetical protein
MPGVGIQATTGGSRPWSRNHPFVSHSIWSHALPQPVDFHPHERLSFFVSVRRWRDPHSRPRDSRRQQM